MRRLDHCRLGNSLHVTAEHVAYNEEVVGHHNKAGYAHPEEQSKVRAQIVLGVGEDHVRVYFTADLDGHLVAEIVVLANDRVLEKRGLVVFKATRIVIHFINRPGVLFALHYLDLQA